MPALSEAGKIGAKAAKVGFDWPDAGGVVEKLREESAELEVEMAAADSQAIGEEIGDLLFTAANLARHLKVDPETALRDANAKFRRRFAAMEAATERPLEELPASELEELWARSKSLGRGAGAMSATAETIRTPAGTEVVLRKCDGFDELDACVRLQIETWGYNDGDVIPRRLFMVAQRIGGQVIGAFEGRTMVGFAMSLPGVKPGKAAGVSPKPYLHSHMLAVTPYSGTGGSVEN